MYYNCLFHLHSLFIYYLGCCFSMVAAPEMYKIGYIRYLATRRGIEKVNKQGI